MKATLSVRQYLPRRRPLSASLSTDTFPTGWASLAQKEFKGQPLEKLSYETPEGIVIKPLYGANDIDGLDVSQGEHIWRLGFARMCNSYTGVAVLPSCIA